jgi:hypothetical protein
MDAIFRQQQVEDLERRPQPSLSFLPRSLGALRPAPYALWVRDPSHEGDQFLAERLLEVARDVFYLGHNGLLVSVDRRRPR